MSALSCMLFCPFVAVSPPLSPRARYRHIGSICIWIELGYQRKFSSGASRTCQKQRIKNKLRVYFQGKVYAFNNFLKLLFRRGFIASSLSFLSKLSDSPFLMLGIKFFSKRKTLPTSHLFLPVNMVSFLMKIISFPGDSWEDTQAQPSTDCRPCGWRGWEVCGFHFCPPTVPSIVGNVCDTISLRCQPMMVMGNK